MLSKFAVQGKVKDSKTKDNVVQSSLAMDEVIKRRLLHDGDGVGDERRFVSMLKQITDFHSGDFAPSELDSRFEKIISQLRQVEQSAKRTHAAIKTCEQTKKVYDGFHEEIKQETEKAKEVIVKARLEIEEETKHRKHSMEYDALSKLIESKPDRKMTKEQREELQKGVKELDSFSKRLEARVKDREKTLKTLSVALNLVKKHVDETDEIRNTKKGPAAVAEPSTSIKTVKPEEPEKAGPSAPSEPVVEQQLPCPETPSSPMEVSSSIATAHEFSQPEPVGPAPGTSGVKEKYEDLSEESPEEGESED